MRREQSGAGHEPSPIEQQSRPRPRGATPTAAAASQPSGLAGRGPLTALIASPPTHNSTRAPTSRTGRATCPPGGGDPPLEPVAPRASSGEAVAGEGTDSRRSFAAPAVLVGGAGAGTGSTRAALATTSPDRNSTTGSTTGSPTAPDQRKRSSY